ncbi:DUF4912 domain-containing protein [Leptotrichia sp. oral taxon 847]|uniref:DUF4912 domain-containing protein n=1 Tax=Leptotrichia sp. oral taxon 847 TaxID=1785996 RepID=UPI0007682590|nr:DUF4912 domain-containing protein [Leptotrichia sp. oral taxon 847]AMD95456.1 hypothetical protein AXF11_07635 [Leptotrichia sp. oral taxon 847]
MVQKNCKTKRTHYRNYVNKKIMMNEKASKELKKVLKFVPFEIIEQMMIVKFLKNIFEIKRSKIFYRNFINKKLIGNLGKKYRKILREISFNYEGMTVEQIKKRYVETEINRSKFAIGTEFDGNSNHEDIYFDKSPLPSSYFVDEIVLMPKNPTTLFAYWEIREDTFRRLSNDNGIVDNIIIKLFKDGQEYRKIVRHERIGSHYITDVDVNENYEVSIGYEDVYGNFSEVAHSVKVISPNDKISDNLDLLWGTVKEDKNTNQLIKYINVPVMTPENREFLELSDEFKDAQDEFVYEIIRRLRKVGSSEVFIEEEVKGRKITSKPDRLDMSGARSS